MEPCTHCSGAGRATVIGSDQVVNVITCVPCAGAGRVSTEQAAENVARFWAAVRRVAA